MAYPGVLIGVHLRFQYIRITPDKERGDWWVGRPRPPARVGPATIYGAAAHLPLSLVAQASKLCSFNPALLAFGEKGLRENLEKDTPPSPQTPFPPPLLVNEK